MTQTPAYKKTKIIMENYNRLCSSIWRIVPDVSQTESSLMIAHINKCLGELREEQVKKNSPEKYEAFKLYYLDNANQEQIAEKLYTTDRTVRRWVTELTETLSVYLFGADAIVIG